MLDWIQNWYNEQCDGNWEHDHGIKIETLDNPGWNVEIDFNYTNLNIENRNWKLYEKSDNDWLGFSIHNNIFSASGDTFKLNILIEIFKILTEQKDINDNFINSLLK